MSSKPISVAFVSGKGGVGKTVLAANFAWVCAQVAKTMLVDLDFQNQGCTGLFAPHFEFHQSNALHSIENPADCISQELNQVAERLYFLPAVSWQAEPSQERITSVVNAAGFQKKVETFIRLQKQEEAFEIVVLDCHGGVDPVSWSAFQSCDYTLMVTEADSVTFAGTLELLNYYEAKAPKVNTGLSSDRSSGQSQPAVSDSAGTDHSPCVKFIVNRLPSKYKWADLEHIYQSYISKKLGIFTTDRSVFCYIPFEELLADCFGEYPFHAELAPKSIFARKIHYMAHSLLSSKCDISPGYKPLRKFQSHRYKKKVERMVVSYEFKNMSSILKFFVWGSVVYLIFLVGGFLLLVGLGTQKILGDVIELILEIFVIAIFTVGVWFFIRASFGLMFHYRDKHKFQKRLFRAISPVLTLWQRLALIKLLMLRIVTTIVVACIVGITSAYIIGFILSEFL
jgi:MinD-like ATPase involved in chromosome partitioning or flagellar assembly